MKYQALFESFVKPLACERWMSDAEQAFMLRALTTQWGPHFDQEVERFLAEGQSWDYVLVFETATYENTVRQQEYINHTLTTYMAAHPGDKI